jgi:OOP family OmpA-OmpF porin
MKRNLIGLALVAGMAMANSAMAQDYDDRWYLTAGAGYGFFDGDRNVKDEFYGTLGVGKFITPNLSLDLEMWHSNPELDTDFSEERNWELMSLSLVGRYHFGEADTWRPYLAFGLGTQEHHDGTQRQPLALGFNESRTGNSLLGIVGVGMQGDLGRGSLRGEIGARFDMDDGSNDDLGDDFEDIFDNDNDDSDSFLDGYAGLTYVFPLGSRAEPVAVVVAPPQKTCADLDDDGDGVNNCNDKCPGSAAGEAIGADGCAMVVTPQPEPEPVVEPKPFRG